jgi:N-glycosylase/DNA lyase
VFGTAVGGDLASKVNELKMGKIGKLVAQRTKEFKNLGGKGDKEWFSELCFCILTANSTAKLGIEIQRKLGDEGFLRLPEEELREKLRQMGYRFPNTRARFFVEAREFCNIKTILKNLDARRAREWLQKNIRGIGWKEASHFLRNVGFDDVAILDRHVLAVLREHKLIDNVPRPLTPSCYLEIEEKLREFARELNIPLGELDLYLWFMKTGDVLK